MDKPVRKLTSFKKLPKPAEPAKPELPPELAVPGMMKPGTVLTEVEQEGLKKLGIVEDTSKLPSNIAEKISSVVASDKPAPMVQPNLKIPEPVDFNSIPEEKKKDILEFIKQASEMKRTIQQEQANDPPPNPKIFKTPEVIDDLLEKPAAVKEEPVKVENPVQFDSDPSGMLGKDAIVVCPHCGWDTRKEDVTEISDDDKLGFVQSILGGVRFRKKYSLFGDRLTVTFRALSTAESDMAYKQLIVDAQDDIQTKVLSDTTFYWRTLMAYRSVMAVEKIESAENILEVPEIKDIEIDADSYKRPNTKLYALFDDLVSQIMPTEALRHTITHVFVEFQALCDKLQAMAESKDFWKAIK
jgi:hypothetical protein